MTHSLIKRFTIQGIAINILLLCSLVALVIGVTAPLLTLQKLYFIENSISLISTIQVLYRDQEWLLFSIISVFSLCVPVIKIVSLLLITNVEYRPGSLLDKSLSLIETLGKWSMLDVFVVALLLVSVKLGALAKVEVHYGLYVFAFSVILTMALSFWIYSLAHKK
ncbi:paraquat-inducible protein A [Leucothrix pacifica]|uniref:Paraquat-inducible membrane protein A n=1 Tax=Leucothrix pacifica TaxID=1247513 RepID=A0A317CKH8_9GAMM|nr:paraquat-inducible protein A [Leucothrix pacifica]PWQ99094.1 paraquat-inducible membrane protein A [Leucothrix pacifica]